MKLALTDSTLPTAPVFWRGADSGWNTVANLFGVQNLCMVSLVIYGAVGLANIMQRQRYWHDVALVTGLVAAVIAYTFGIESVLDSVIVGGFVSLVVAKLFARFRDSRRQRGTFSFQTVENGLLSDAVNVDADEVF